MERVDSVHYSPHQQQQQPHTTSLLKPMTATTTTSTQITMAPHSSSSSSTSSGGNGNGHHARRSVSGMDILNGLKIVTNAHLHHHINNNNDSIIPSTPVPTSAITNVADTNTVNTFTQHHFSPSHIEDFEIKDPIGYGSSAIVYKAIYKPLDKPMALKEIDLDKFERNQIDELRRETALMALSKHPNVLRVYGSFVHGSKLYIVTPFLAGGSCLDIMKTRFPEGMDELSIATILKQALEALIYLHKNGHIHRDVKAGNLLVDDQDGTVLLADFGVSSSLMETGEKGMRKTFVGTPCWMAPEVMEQEAYDYKADIWSFGITALELATGHAPFAKYPPLKVLMMTLASEPPTLDREHTYYKYSKTFKDMVDLCLVKDPTKRPTADKLILHPFFKQAKRKEYLMRTILSDLPPLEQRPRKKLPKRQINIYTTTQQPGDAQSEDDEDVDGRGDGWNFDDDDDEDNEDKDEDNNRDENNRTDLNPQANLKASVRPITAARQQQTKKHISFGDVIVKGNNTTATPTASNNMIHPADNNNGMMSPLPILSGTPPTAKKSRFVIEEAAENAIIAGSEDEEKQPLNIHKMPSQDNISSSSTSSDRMAALKPSRFEVSSPMLYQSVPLSRDNSSSYSSTSTSTTTAAPLPPATNNAAIHIISSPSLSSTRDKKAPSVDEQFLTAGDQHQHQQQQHQQSRKIGRFELTSNSSTANTDYTSATTNSSSAGSRHGSFSDHHHHHLTSSPQLIPHHPYHQHSHSITVSTLPSLQASSLLTHPYYQIEELLRINDSQRQLLQDIYSSFSTTTNTASNANASKKLSLPSTPANNVNEELLATIEHLEGLVQQSVKENHVLRKENENLRHELEMLKQQP